MNTKKNYIPNFIFYLFLLVAFLLSMLLSQTYLDIKASLFLNSLFKNNLFIFQKTIAIINSRYGDWFYEITIIMLYIMDIFIMKKDKKKRFTYLFFLIISIFFTQLIFNTFFLKHLDILKLSPSRYIEMPFDFSIFNYPHNRVFTNHSFPSDRATTIFLIVLFLKNKINKKSYFLIVLMSLTLLLTRLIVGAHWCSDVLGTFFTSFIIYKIILYTHKITKYIFNPLLKN